MVKITPSRQRFREAKAITLALQRAQGANLRAVFVVGSTAANVANNLSDLDLVVVSDKRFDPSEVVTHSKFSPNFLTIPSKVFENLSSLPGPPKVRVFKPGEAIIVEADGSIVKKALAAGAVPIFGKEYAVLHKTSWKFPRLTTIKERYSVDGSLAGRVRFKRKIKGRARFR